MTQEECGCKEGGVMRRKVKVGAKCGGEWGRTWSISPSRMTEASS